MRYKDPQLVSFQVLGPCFAFLTPCVINLSRNKYFCCQLKKAVVKSRVKFWLFCWFFTRLATCLGSSPNKSTNQRAAFLQPATNVFIAFLTREVKNREISTQNLQRNNAAWQVEGFCVSYLAALTLEYVPEFSMNESSKRCSWVDYP